MNKMNKKGFTLIEMLVVIAIIAVLVSIVIPVVGNSTAKAEAATDAANLRSAKASLTIAVMNGAVTKPEAGADGAVATAAVTWPTTGYGTAPVCKSNDEWTFSATVSSDGEVVVKFGSYTIKSFSDFAGGDATAVTAPPTT